MVILILIHEKYGRKLCYVETHGLIKHVNSEFDSEIY